MVLKQRIEKIKKPNIIKNNKVVPAVRHTLCFVAGLILSLGNVTGDLRPFGISLISVSKREYIISSALGSFLGCLIFGIDDMSPRYIIAFIIAAIGAFLTGFTKSENTPTYPMIISFIACLSTGVIYCLRANSIIQQYILITGEAILCSGASFFFFRSLNAAYRRFRLRAMPLGDLSCIVISLSILLMNLSVLRVFTIRPAVCIATALMLTALRYAGDRWGMIIALAFGFTISIAENGELYMAGALAFSVLVAALFSPTSNIGAGLGFLFSMSFFAVVSQGSGAVPIISESALGMIIFLLLPEKLRERLSDFSDSSQAASCDGSLRQNLVLKLRFASSAMVAISQSVDQVREKITDLARRDSSLNKENMTEEEFITQEVILEKTNQIRMVAGDQFYSISKMLDDLAAEFNEAETFNTAASSKIRQLLSEYELYPKNISVIEDKYGRLRVEILTDGFYPILTDNRLCTEIGQICSRYLDKGKITNFMNETMLSFSEKPSYKLSVATAQHSAEGRHCGDTIKVIKDNKGHYILIISDGMGKGSRAALDGAMGAGLLSRLINSGFGFDSALQVVNSALLVKSNDESLATLDVANIDLFTGKCELFKAGAPASYIVKNSSVTKCELCSMPAGILRGIEFAKRTAVLSPDSSILLMSDGITDLGEEWIREKLHSIPNGTTQEIADYILESAIQDTDDKKMDDMSIIYAKLERN